MGRFDHKRVTKRGSVQESLEGVFALDGFNGDNKMVFALFKFFAESPTLAFQRAAVGKVARDLATHSANRPVLFLF